MENKFKLKSDFKPAGDQPQAIKSLVEGIKKGVKHQTLLGVTGSGKTFTIANVIEKIGKPTLVLAHNKTLAAQLTQEYRDFFPENAVHYFVSYYDYYQPEAYMPITDTYIEKEAMINEEIDRLRHATTQALLTRKDVIIVASVSAIYGLGNPVEYEKVNIKIEKGMKTNRAEFIRKLIGIYFERTNADLTPGKFRAIGNTLEIMPINEKVIYRIEFVLNRVLNIDKINAISRMILEDDIGSFFLFPAKHFVTPETEKKRAILDIKEELKVRLAELKRAGKILEPERLKRRTNYDIALIKEIGYTSGIENYSRHFDGRKEGEPPYTLLSYFPKDFLTIIDESHVTVPQLGGMYAGDRARKKTLIEHGFRLPSAFDNRPLNFEEFEKKVGQVIYTSATPGVYEKEKSENTVEQIIRPTGLLDPRLDIKPIIEQKKVGRATSTSDYKGQIQDFIKEAQKAIKKGGRAIAVTLTKKMAEDLSEYLKDKNIKAEYLHSDIKTIDRITILKEFRKGKFDVLVGVNLLREGLDLPEVVLMGILDADKEGFLRSETSLIQTIGRVARNATGRVILYADNITGSMKRAIDETNRRRKIQLEYNKKRNITPKTIIKNIKDITEQIRTEHQKSVETLLKIDKDLYKKNPKKLIKQKEKQMSGAVKILDFETAAILRDEIKTLTKKY
ncbi:MAG: excinuclease ABC subunit UvrB [Patescibacteria group bacterium]